MSYCQDSTRRLSNDRCRLESQTPQLEVQVPTIEPVWLSLVISAVVSPDAPLWMKILASEPTPAR